MNIELTKYGFDEKLKASCPTLAEGTQVGRILADYNHVYEIVTADGFTTGYAPAKGMNPDQVPAVGDWVTLVQHEDRYIVDRILPRRSKFSRKIAGQTVREQIVGCNVDYLFLMTSMNQDFNLRRLERYLIVAWDSGALPVILLSKADLCDDVADKVSRVEAIAPGVAIHVVSALREDGLEALAPYLQEGRTIALIGMSGVGKSTLLNTLMGEQVLKTAEIREDGRGKHTTTHRQLVLRPQGGLLLDTPGMRELGLWQVEAGISQVFTDIEQLAEDCRFRDCSHKDEPGCAVREAVADGTLDVGRLESYEKLRREMAFMEKKQRDRMRQDEKRARRCGAK